MDYNCYSSSAVAFVTVDYYNSTCSINSLTYTSVNFHLFTIISYIFIYIITTFLIFYSFITYKYIKLLLSVMTPERNALIAIHPDGYWQALVQAGNPFANMFGRR